MQFKGCQNIQQNNSQHNDTQHSHNHHHTEQNDKKLHSVSIYWRYAGMSGCCCYAPFKVEQSWATQLITISFGEKIIFNSLSFQNKKPFDNIDRKMIARSFVNTNPKLNL
jgi:hypothetical protein